jgi:tetratricopeptide (TPR) repeat protein
VANIETGSSRPSHDFLVRVVDVFPEHEPALVQAYNALPPRTRRSGYKYTDADRVAQDRFNLLIRIGRSHEARAGMELALRGEPQPVQRLWLLRRLAELQLQVGDFDGAVERYREAIEVAMEETLPGWEGILRDGLSRRLTLEGRIAEAHAVLDEGLARNVEQGALWFAKGDAHWYEHEYAAAFACLMTAEAFGLRRAQVDFSRGHVLAEWGHYSAAIADLTHALNRRMSARDHAYTRAALAYAYGHLGDLSRALTEFAAAEEVIPDNGWFYYYRARVYLLHGEEELALRDLRSALSSPMPLNAPKRQHALELIENLGRRHGHGAHVDQAPDDRPHGGTLGESEASEP